MLLDIVMLFTTPHPTVAIVMDRTLLSYHSYVLRTQVSEGLSLAAGTKADLGVMFAEHGDFKAEYHDVKLRDGKYVETSSVTYAEDGQSVRITYEYGRDSNPRIYGKHLTIVGESSEDGVKWSCSSDDLPVSSLPEICLDD